MSTSPPDRPDAPSGRSSQEPGRAAPPTEGSPRRDTLDYARAILAELSAIARRERLDMLAYLIEMAYVEAADLLARDAAAGGRSRRPVPAATPKRRDHPSDQ